MTDISRQYDLDWSDVSEDMARQILHQGEIHMAAQLQAALASDQRATTSASLFAGFATALLGAVLAYSKAHPSDSALFVGGVVSVAFLVMAAILCFLAARPVNFYWPGNNPVEWFEARDEPLAVALGGEAENYDPRIEANAQFMDNNAKLFMAGALSAVVAPVAGLIVWALLSSPA